MSGIHAGAISEWKGNKRSTRYANSFMLGTARQLPFTWAPRVLCPLCPTWCCITIFVTPCNQSQMLAWVSDDWCMCITCVPRTGVTETWAAVAQGKPESPGQHTKAASTHHSHDTARVNVWNYIRCSFTSLHITESILNKIILQFEGNHKNKKCLFSTLHANWGYKTLHKNNFK